MKSEDDGETSKMWRELVEAEAATIPRSSRGTEPLRPDVLQPAERCQLLLPGWEPVTYVREDVHEAELLVAYRRGRWYEAHAKRLLAAAMFAFGLAAASLAFLIVAEIWLH